MMKGSKSLRLLALATFLSTPFLVGVGPGYAGGCSGSAPDARQYCYERKNWECVRETERGVASGAIPASQRDAVVAQCVADVESVCRDAAWPPACAPTSATTGRCVAALRDASRLQTATSDLNECKAAAVCASAPTAP